MQSIDAKLPTILNYQNLLYILISIEKLKITKITLATSWIR